MLGATSLRSRQEIGNIEAAIHAYSVFQDTVSVHEDIYQSVVRRRSGRSRLFVRAGAEHPTQSFAF